MSDQLADVVDRWFVKEYAFSTTVVAVRGEMAIKAASKLHDSDLVVPILVEQEELEEYDKVDRDEVPDWGAEFLAEQHQIRSKNIQMAAKAGGSSE